MSKTYYCTLDELLVACMARTIKDHDVVFNGVAVALPFTAILLAKNTHAPNSVFLGGLLAGVDPQPPFLPPTSGDSVMIQGAVTVLPLHEVFDLAQKGSLDRIFFSGGQIDRYGNLNNTLVGSPEKIKVKLPGGAGASNLSCFAGNFTVWTTRHRINSSGPSKTYTLTDSVDFITTAGHLTPSGPRKEAGIMGGGPDWLITDLGVFDFTGEGQLRLKTLHPGVTLEDVLENTGFRPAVADSLEETSLPTIEEIEIIRRIDPLNVRKREFSPSQLERRYTVRG